MNTIRDHVLKEMHRRGRGQILAGMQEHTGGSFIEAKRQKFLWRTLEMAMTGKDHHSLQTVAYVT